MPPSALLGLAVLALIGWIWFDAMRAREAANRACLQACRRLNVQFLNQTVALRRLGAARGRDGRLRLKRTYSFEYSENGWERRHGTLVLVGRQVTLLHLEGGDA